MQKTQASTLCCLLRAHLRKPRGHTIQDNPVCIPGAPFRKLCCIQLASYSYAFVRHEKVAVGTADLLISEHIRDFARTSRR